MFKDKKRLSLLLSIAIVLVTWIFIISLHWQNDGLWYQGDSPRHAANGIFWKDFLLSGSHHPQNYALRYYARYPVIAPAGYPPVFYLVEGALFSITGASPYVAKGLVLVFALTACLYLIAWLRRWVAPDAGWEASLLLLLPGFVIWSNAVMLNVPATALAFAALYHSRRWIESPPGRLANCQLYLTASLLVLATLTYLPAGIAGAIVLAWVLVSRRWALLLNRRSILAALAIALIILPVLYFLMKWSPTHVAMARNILHTANRSSHWLYYWKVLKVLVGPLLLVVSAIGFIASVLSKRFRRESLYLLVFLLVEYLCLSVLNEREPRYALLCCIPIVCYCSIGFHAFAMWLGSRMMNRRRVAMLLAVSAAVILYGFQTRIAAQTHVDQVEGISDVAGFMGQVAPQEPVFYDGFHEGVFCFYVKASDPNFKRRVVLGSKLLYASALGQPRRFRSFVSSTQNVLQTLRTRGGCRWLAIEVSGQDDKNPAALLLREAVRGPEFELVRSFPVSAWRLERIDVYRFREPVPSIEEVDLPFQILGDGVRFKARPIEK